ncbi:MAG: RNA-directed DNA polymerase [Planctomycetes bacterium]|nr:RNA-directed DNA polymerase [Planctomycetota bacterium]
MDPQQRFVRNIAAGMLAGEWSRAGLRDAIRRATGREYRWASPLVTRLLAAHIEPPSSIALLDVLVRDTTFAGVLARLAGARTAGDRYPRRTLFAVPGEAIPPAPTWNADLPRWDTEHDCADALGVALPQLLWLADPTGRNPYRRDETLRTYRARWVLKPRGGARLLEVPKPLLRRTQRRLVDLLLNRVAPHPAAHGFRAGRSAVTNAAEHCGRAAVLRFDLTDFFSSIVAGRTFGLFRNLGYPEPVVRLLGALCTTRLPRAVWDVRPHPTADGSDYPAWVRVNTRHLPQGAPTSPALANLIAYRLDRRLARLAAACGATYTRYADDLTFSGGPGLLRAARGLARRVALIAAEEGFRVNRGKSRAYGRGTRQTVTGIVTNVRPNVTRAEFDLLKAILTNCTRHGPAGQNRAQVPDFRAHLAGRVAHVAGVNSVRGRKLWELFDRIVWPVDESSSMIDLKDS